MIPYWTVNVEWRQRVPHTKRVKYTDHFSVWTFDTFEKADDFARDYDKYGWHAKGEKPKRPWPKHRRATVSGPHYRQGF